MKNILAAVLIILMMTVPQVFGLQAGFQPQEIVDQTSLGSSPKTRDFGLFEIPSQADHLRRHGFTKYADICSEW